MLAADGGAVFDGSDYALQPKKNMFHAHVFAHEEISYTIGGAIVVKNANACGVTILIDCTFLSNFG